MGKASNNLGLIGDGDDVDMLTEAENTFGVTFTHKEASRISNVGQFYDLIVGKYRADHRDTRACLSQMAFYRLRRAVAELGHTGPITPATPIAEVMPALRNGRSMRQSWRDLGRLSGLSLPHRELPWLLPYEGAMSFVGYLTMMTAIAVTMLALQGLTGMHVIWSAIAGVAAVVIAPLVLVVALNALFGAVPKRIVTIADLTREAAGHSFRSLHGAKPGCGPADLWLGLTAILRTDSGYRGPIDRETTFFRHEART